MIKCVKFLLAAAAVTGSIGFGAPASANTGCVDADTSARELAPSQAAAAVVCLTNEERAANGLPELQADAALDATAAGHSQDIVANHIDPYTCAPDPRSAPGSNPSYWWSCIHAGSDGGWPEDRIWAAGWCTFCALGENVYMGWGAGYDTPRAAVAWWMGSPDHRAAILNDAFQYIGVGVEAGMWDAPDGSTFTQNFGGPMS